LWSRDAYGIPAGTNLYGNHPVYFDHRGADGTHGVFLLNSNGMDIKINNTQQTGQYLEYNTIGGIIDLYFMAGPTPNDVAQQYSEVVAKPAMMPYFGEQISNQISLDMHRYIMILTAYLFQDLASINADTDTEMYTKLQLWLRITVQQESPWK
jgi:alpha-glucosidase (family GH31 glycosyl hydrolase)